MCIAALIPQTMAEARHNIDPELPVGRGPLQERVSGLPTNPGCTIHRLAVVRPQHWEAQKFRCPSCNTEFQGHQVGVMPCPVCVRTYLRTTRESSVTRTRSVCGRDTPTTPTTQRTGARGVSSCTERTRASGTGWATSKMSSRSSQGNRPRAKRTSPAVVPRGHRGSPQGEGAMLPGLLTHPTRWAAYTSPTSSGHVTSCGYFRDDALHGDADWASGCCKP